VCDVMVIISQSSGVRREVERANELGIPVYYGVKNFLEAK